MAGKRDVVDFIKEVEKHPCIYNVTMPEYSNRDETKRAWGKVAESMECSESECKERWRKLRIAFMRSLKHMKANNSTKQYYLHNYLAFLLPYIKIGEQQIDDQEENAMESFTYSGEDEDLYTPKKYSKVEMESDDENNTNTTNGHVIYFDDRTTGRSFNESYHQGRQRTSIDNDRKRKRTADVEDNPRKMFLLSLLPDVESFSEEEMRKFRRNVVNCIDTIMDGRQRQC